MAHILKNNNLEIHIDLPSENYHFSRFDWTGKISKVIFNKMAVTTSEKKVCENENIFGKGFYNEFGIDNALGFKEAKIGESFHKIGIGVLKKTSDQYLFHESYSITPLKFEIIKKNNSIQFKCESPNINGFSYILEKQISLLKSGFKIDYLLTNTGENRIETNEYVHNFVSLDNELMNQNYALTFPFSLNLDNFKEIVNLENKVKISKNSVTFDGNPKEQFFISYLNGENKTQGNWKLTNSKSKIGISETTDFNTPKMNLWGWEHVISPEIFINIKLQPNQSKSWSRNYNIFNI